MISHLTGRARTWATTEWARSSDICATSKRFAEALRAVFDPVATDREKAQELSRLKQGGDSVCDYAIRFRTLATESGWNATALYDTFLKGLSDPIQDLLISLDLPPDLDLLIALAICTDNRLQEWKQRRGTSYIPASAFSSSVVPWRTGPHRLPPDQPPRPAPQREEEPMQLGRARLSQEEREWRSPKGRCFYCGTQGHLVADCPSRQT